MVTFVSASLSASGTPSLLTGFMCVGSCGLQVCLRVDRWYGVFFCGVVCYTICAVDPPPPPSSSPVSFPLIEQHIFNVYGARKEGEWGRENINSLL